MSRRSCRAQPEPSDAFHGRSFVTGRVGMRLVSYLFKKFFVEPHADIIVTGRDYSRVLDFIARKRTCNVNAYYFVLTIDFAQDGSITTGHVSRTAMFEYQACGVIPIRIRHMTRFKSCLNVYISSTSTAFLSSPKRSSRRKFRWSLTILLAHSGPD